jgi:nucleoid-associated protein YgaU
MTTTSMRRMVVPGAALIAAIAIALVFGIQHIRREPAVEAKAAIAAPAPSKPASSAPAQAPSTLAMVQEQAKAVAAALALSPPLPDRADGVPAFDVARIEPTGDAVVAGRAAPGATVELLRNGEVHDRAVADQSGQFVMVTPRLPPGTYDLTLRSKTPDGNEATSKQSVAVALDPSPNEKPVVALMTPDKPSVVLSKPASPKPTAGMVVIEAVEMEPSGKFHVSGRSRPGAEVRLYLNDSFIASVTAGPDERFAVTIKEGISPGNYRVRLDELGSNSATVHARAEVPFSVPESAVTASVQAVAPKRPDMVAPQHTQLAAATPIAISPDNGSSSAVVVPKIATTTVYRGDSLWRISRLAYGAGTRFAVVYRANREQIRNPNVIYPGQIFVLPKR